MYFIVIIEFICAFAIRRESCFVSSNSYPQLCMLYICSHVWFGVILSFSSAKGPDQPLRIVYVPSHLYHMLFELFKVSPYNDILKLKVDDRENIGCMTLGQ